MRYSHFFSCIIVSFFDAENSQFGCLHGKVKSTDSMSCSTAKARILLFPANWPGGARQLGHELPLFLVVHSSQRRWPFWHCVMCPSFGIWRHTTHWKVSCTFLLSFASVSFMASSRASFRIRFSSESSAVLGFWSLVIFLVLTIVNAVHLPILYSKRRKGT